MRRWGFHGFTRDQATAQTDELLHEVASGAIVVVPSFWFLEMANVLLMAQRRRILTAPPEESRPGKIDRHAIYRGRGGGGEMLSITSAGLLKNTASPCMTPSIWKCPAPENSARVTRRGASQRMQAVRPPTALTPARSMGLNGKEHGEFGAAPMAL